MKWLVDSGNHAAILKDEDGKALGGLVRKKEFCLGFVYDEVSPVLVGAERVPMRLLGAYPSIVATGKRVESEVRFFLAHGMYPNIVKR